MTAGQIVAWIAIPMGIFILGAFGTGVTMLVKGSAYMARSAVAQESTATSNKAIEAKLSQYIAANDGRVNDLDRRVFVLEDRRVARAGEGRF